ncbi:hypothetical protein OK016_14880 [Vibrio chagasii]|nr:hypothetical protein [Vibrio chagasii]
MRKNRLISSEVDDPRARNVDIDIADIHVSKSEYAGKTMAQLHAEIGWCLLQAVSRQGHQQPLLPQTKGRSGRVVRIAGSQWCVKRQSRIPNSIAFQL